MIATVAFSSCEKDPIGGTATQKVAGEWYVKYEALNNAGEVLYEYMDLSDAANPPEFALVNTYNTASNVADKMYISDINDFTTGAYSGAYNFFGFQVLVDVDQAAGTFSTKDYVQNNQPIINYDKYECDNKFLSIKIANGKIGFGEGKQKNGSPADSISFDLYIEESGLYELFVVMYNEGILPGAVVDMADPEAEAASKIDHFRISGVRYSGLVENE